MPTWLSTPPSLPLPAKAAELLVRTARLDVLRKIAAGEKMAAQMGAPVEGFTRLRHALQAMPVTTPALTVPTARSLRSLVVRRLPGSAF